MNATQLLAHFDRLAEAPDAVPRLRRFILDLAVRGKLVAQDAGDEPAVELLKRIHVERLRILNKSLKSSVAFAIEPESTDIQLPAGWAWSRLSSLCTKTGSGSTPSGGKDAYVSSGVPFLRSQNVYDNGLRLEGVAFISNATQERMNSTTVKAGDLLLNITGGSIGRCAIVPDSFVIGNINQHVAIIRLALLESGRFMHSVICSDYFQKHIFGNQTGAGREGLPKNRMDEILIPVAPLAEQHRIVAKVEELMALCDQLGAAQQERERRRDRLASASLQRLNQPATDTTPETQREYAGFHLHHLPRLVTRPEHIKALRQTFFNLAVCGRLVEQDADDEPVVKLLKRLGVQVAKSQADANPPIIPATWAWVTIDQVATVGSGTTPSRDVPDYFSPVGTPWVTSGETSNAFITQTAQHVSEKALKETSLKLYPPGTLIVAMYGQGKTRGQVAELGIAATTNQACAAIVLKLEDVAHRRYVKLYFQKIYEEIRELAAGGAQPNLNGGKIKSTLIPFPPLAEQRRIVTKVDELMALCDQFEAQLTTTQIDSRRLLEAVLDEALAPVN